MKVLKPRVKAQFYAVMKELETRDIAPTPEEIIWIHELSERTISPDRQDVPLFFDVPIKVGRVWLYSLSIQAEIWLESYAYKWWRKSRTMDMLAMAFAMAHSRTGDVLPKIASKTRAAIRIKFWAAKNLICSRKRLQFAVSKLLGSYEYLDIDDENKPDENVDVSEWGDLIALACGRYPGLKPEDFLFKMSANEAMGMIKNAPLPMGCERPDTNSSSTRAFWELRLAIKHIIKTHSAEEESAGADG